MYLSKTWIAYVSDKEFMGYSPYTLNAYRLQFKLLLNYLGDIDIKEITFEQLKAYIMQTSKHLKSSSIGHKIRFIRSFFRWAMEEGFNTYNPASKLREPKQETRVPKALSEDDLEAIRISCKDNFERALLEFLFSSGCRVGEVVKINKNMIDWENKSIVVNGKGNKEREIYFTSKCKIYLKKYLNERKDNDPALFATRRHPYKRMSIEQIRWVIKRIATRSDIETNVYPHKLRHTYANNLLLNNASLDLIQNLLGHSKSETTRLYANLSGARRKELYQRHF